MRLERREKWRDNKAERIRLRAAGDTTNPQENLDNLEYMGPLYMGENLEEVDVVWDTGSDWLVVASY